MGFKSYLFVQSHTAQVLGDILKYVATAFRFTNTPGSYQAIGRSLGHKSTQATQIYARLNLDVVRSSVEKATEAMFQLSKTQTSKI